MPLPQTAPITSRSNRQAKRLDMLLRNKKAREESGEFALEGARLCLDALERGVAVLCVLLTLSAYKKNPALEGLVSAAGEVAWLDESLAARLGDTQNPQGIFCVCKTPSLTHTAVPICGDGRYLLLHGVRDPGNLGAILRTAAAFGADGAFLCDCAELFSPKVLRASMGGVWRLPAAVCPDMTGKIRELREAGVKVYAATPQGDAKSPDCLSGRHGRAVLIGSEGDGLPETLISLCDTALAIPMQGGSESLNAAVAAGILLWEMLK